jgi:hypothetical protein
LTLGESKHKGGNTVAGRRAIKKQASLCSDNVAGGRGWHSRKIKLKKSEHEEGHIALRGIVANIVACNHMWVKPCSLLL